MKLIRLPEALTKTGLSRTQLYVRIGRGDFPAPVKLGKHARAIAFPETEVDQWIEGRIAERDASSAEAA